MQAQEFFKACTIEGNRLFMPSRDVMEVDPKFFTKEVRKPLLNLGGVYYGGADAYWKFDFDPTDRIEEFRNGKQTKLSSKFHFFETPIELAAHMFSFAEESGIKYWECMDLPTAKALEPSAGRGALITRLYIQNLKDVYYYENMPENREIMEKYNYYGNIPTYLGDDFMKGTAADFDIVIANPPFRDEFKHIQQMLKVLKSGGVLLSISSPKLYNNEKFIEMLGNETACWGMRELESSKDDPIFQGTAIGCTIIVCKKK